MNLQKILRGTVITLLFLIPIFPLFVANSLFFPFITGKAFYFRILIELAFAGWVILAFLDARYRPRLSPLMIVVTLFTVVTLVADLLGVNPLRSITSNFERMEGWYTIVHLWAFFMVAVHTLGAERDHKVMWHRWFNVSLFIAVIVALYGFAQMLGLAVTHQGVGRIDASLGNSEYMAVYMLFHAFIAAYFFFLARSKKITNAKILVWIYPILALVFAFLLFQTQTRGAMLGIIGGVMLAFGCYAVFGRKESNKHRMIAGGALLLIILSGLIFWMNRDAAIIQKSVVLKRLASISWKDTTSQARAYVWPMAIQGALERPIYGWGQENFNYIFNAKYNPKMWSQEQWFDRAHSVYLEWLVNAGFVGLIIYLAFYVLFLRALWKSSLSMAEKSVLTGLLGAYAVHNIFVFDNMSSYLLFFAMLSFVSSLEESKPIAWLGTKPVRLDAVEYIVAPAVVLVLAISIYLVNVRPIQANERLILALSACSQGKPDPELFIKALEVGSTMANQEIREQVLQCSGRVITGQTSADLKQAFYGLTLDTINRQIEDAPLDARMYVLGGSLLAVVNQYEDAKPILEKAHELSPGKQTVSFQLASVYMNMGMKDEALALLKQAYEADPTFEESRSTYVVGLILAGKEADARKLFASEPELFETVRVARVYMSLKQYDKAITIFKKLVQAAPTDVDTSVQLAQAYYTAQRIADAVTTMRNLVKSHPELKDQIEEAIKQIQAPQTATQ